jgi:hypothetical protein
MPDAMTLASFVVALNDVEDEIAVEEPSSCSSRRPDQPAQSYRCRRSQSTSRELVRLLEVSVRSHHRQERFVGAELYRLVGILFE